jgi:mannosyltransferase
MVFTDRLLSVVTGRGLSMPEAPVTSAAGGDSETVTHGLPAQRGPEDAPDSMGTPDGTAGPAVEARPSGWAAAGVWAVPALVCLALVRWQAGTPYLWRDELATWSAVHRPFPAMLGMAGHVDFVYLPYYSFMRLWTSLFGDSELALRLPSILAMSGAAALAAVLARRLHGPRAGMVAGLLVAMLPTVTWYGQSARPYGLVVLGVVAATVLLLDALDSPDRRRWTRYCLAIGLACLMNIFALLVLPGHAVLVARSRCGAESGSPGRVWRAWLIAASIAAAPAVPLALVSSRQTGQIAWIAPVNWDAWNQLPEGLFFIAGLGWVLLALAIAGPGARGTRPGATAGVAAAAFLPPVALFALSYLHPVWVPRYVLYTMPLLCVLAAVAVGSSWIRALGLLALAAALALPAQTWLHVPGAHGQADMGQVRQILAGNEQPGDGMIYGTSEEDSMMREAVDYYVPEKLRPRDVLAVRSYVQADSLLAVECADAAGCLNSSNRLWTLLPTPIGTPIFHFSAQLRDILNKDWTQAQRWDVTWGTLILYTRNSAAR